MLKCIGIGESMLDEKVKDLPRLHPEVDAWVNEMLYYDPRSHTGDRLMASWFAREAARQGTIRAEVGYLPTMRR